MAGFNEILAGRFNRALQKFFSMKGPASVNELSSIIAANIPLFWGVENRYLEGWSLFAETFFFGASAGNHNMIQIRNPANSGVIAVIQQFLLTSTAIDEFFIGQFLGSVAPVADFTTPVASTNNRLDPRGFGATGSSMVLSQKQQAAASGAFGRFGFRIPAAFSTLLPIVTQTQECPLLPGDSWVIEQSTVNQAGDLGFFWRERVLEDSEKN